MNVFSLDTVRPDLVVLGVNADDPLTVALNPFVSSDMAYISVTRGTQHVLTVVRKDGTTWNFEWGYDRYTLIGGSSEALKKAVINFVKVQTGIDLNKAN